MGAFYALRAREGKQILPMHSFTSVETIRGYSIAVDVPSCTAWQPILADQWAGSNQTERTLELKFGRQHHQCEKMEKFHPQERFGF